MQGRGIPTLQCWRHQLVPGACGGLSPCRPPICRTWLYRRRASIQVTQPPRPVAVIGSEALSVVALDTVSVHVLSGECAAEPCDYTWTVGAHTWQLACACAHHGWWAIR